MTTPPERVANLSFWSGPVQPQTLGGGISNHNFTVEDGGETYVVRIGEDIPEHHVFRWNEVAASKAAFAAGISPELVHHEQGVLILRYIESETLTPEMVCERAQLERIVALIQRYHRDMPKHFRGPALIFWPFHVMRDYTARLNDENSRMIPELPRLSAAADKLERAVGQIDLVFGHNDLLAANLLDDGDRLWLIDWEYGAYSSPLFDLGNLASNNELKRADEQWLLEAYFDRPLDDGLWRSYAAMKCASLLRETMWSMVAEIHSPLDFDYAAYTDEYLQRFDGIYAAVDQEVGLS